jgi:L-threonylcarbamoyladenylate synthase
MRITVDQAANILQTGGVIGAPTETVYGLAASLSCPEAIDKIFALKKRPQDNPLIIHVATVEQIIPFAKTFPPRFHELANAFWPGPLTLIIPIDPETVVQQVRAGLPTAGFRIPNHVLTGLLIEKTGPLAMPSANLSGRPSSTTLTHVEEDFGSDFPVLDGGSCVKGLESTILCYREEGSRWSIARLGALSAEAFEPVLGYKPSLIDKNTERLCPGQFHRHYAPKAKLLLGTTPNLEPDCIVGFSDRSYPSGRLLMTWGTSTDPEAVAANLYHVLRQLDKQDIQTAWVDTDFPSDGLWATIAERIRRAAQEK